MCYDIVSIHCIFVSTSNEILGLVQFFSKFFGQMIDKFSGFSALMLLVGRQEGYPARKKYGGMVEVGTG